MEDFLEDTLYKEIFLPGGESSEGIETGVERVEEYVKQFTQYIQGKYRNLNKKRVETQRHCGE